jgi:hypothetical protein
MTRGPVTFRRRRGYIAVGSLPGLRGWLPAVGVGITTGFLLYWADVTLHDALFHPVRSLRDLGYSLGEVLVEFARMLPFVLVATAVTLAVWLLVRRWRSERPSTAVRQEART